MAVPKRSSPRGKHAYLLCRGLGLEVGALHDPFELDATVLRLDHLGTKDLKARYAGSKRGPFVKSVDLIAAAPPYSFLDDDVFDFVVSSHVLEHMPNPGLALAEWLRVTRPGGVVYSVIPNKNRTFDRRRATTPVDTIMRAFERAEPRAPLAQYEDFYKNKQLEGNETRPTDDEIRKRWEKQHSIHVYTYTPESAREFAERMGRALGASLEFFTAEGIDIHFVLKKAGDAPPRGHVVQPEVSPAQSATRVSTLGLVRARIRKLARDPKRFLQDSRYPLLSRIGNRL